MDHIWYSADANSLASVQLMGRVHLILDVVLTRPRADDEGSDMAGVVGVPFELLHRRFVFVEEASLLRGTSHNLPLPIYRRGGVFNLVDVARVTAPSRACPVTPRTPRLDASWPDVAQQDQETQYVLANLDAATDFWYLDPELFEIPVHYTAP